MGKGAVLSQIIKSYTYVVIWMSISISVILFNKWLLAFSGLSPEQFYLLVKTYTEDRESRCACRLSVPYNPDDVAHVLLLHRGHCLRALRICQVAQHGPPRLHAPRAAHR